MASLVKYNALIDNIASGGHNLKTAVIKCALTADTPNAATDTTMTYTPPTNVNGYPSGGNTLTTTSAATSGGLFTLKLADTVFTGASGGIGPFRYAVLYNSSASNKLIGYYDYGIVTQLGNTETLTVDFDDTNGALTIA
jgi:hypothetical protein